MCFLFRFFARLRLICFVNSGLTFVFVGVYIPAVFTYTIVRNSLAVLAGNTRPDLELTLGCIRGEYVVVDTSGFGKIQFKVLFYVLKKKMIKKWSICKKIIDKQ